MAQSYGIEPFANPRMRQWAEFDCSYDGENGFLNASKTVSDCVDGPYRSEVRFTETYHHIDHSSDIWLDCYPDVTASLVDGATPLEGRIQMTGGLFGFTGTLCNDVFDRDPYAQLAICRIAGFPNATRASYKYFGYSPYEPFFVSDLRCPPFAGSLLDCTHTPEAGGRTNCFMYEQAGVRCIIDTPTGTISPSVPALATRTVTATLVIPTGHGQRQPLSTVHPLDQPQSHRHVLPSRGAEANRHPDHRQPANILPIT